MPQWKLYHIWMKKLEELRPGERVTRLRNLTWLLVGLYSAQAVHLSKVAAKLPGLSYLPSRIRRLSRLPPSRGRGEVDNPAIQVRAWYEPVARGLLQRLAGGVVHLVVDGSKVGFGHQLLMVAVAYRRRTIPLTRSRLPASVTGSRLCGQRAAARETSDNRVLAGMLKTTVRGVRMSDTFIRSSFRAFCIHRASSARSAPARTPCRAKASRSSSLAVPNCALVRGNNRVTR